MRGPYNGAVALGGMLRTQRRALRQRQEDAAVPLGVDQSTVSKWENATALPEPRHYEAIGSYLGIDRGEVARILHGEPNDNGVAERLTDLEGRVERIEALMAKVAARRGRG